MSRYHGNQRTRQSQFPVQTTRRTVAIRINQGMALKHLAGLYPTLHDVLLEQVQNALDVDVVATRIWIKINQKTRFITVRDNGSGASTTKFEEALSSVAEPGRKGRGSIGQFGIGLISPLGKCARFTFTSCPHPQLYGFMQWVLETERLFAQRDTITMPVPRSMPELTLDKNPANSGKQVVEWRTEVSMYDTTEDRLIGNVDPEALIGAILDRFGAVMRKNRVRLTVSFTSKKGEHRDWQDVTASEFRGRKLPEVVINTPTGRTQFRIFVARATKGGRDGRVLMGTTRDESRFPFHFLARSTDKLLAEDVVTALSSGVFEGEIVSEGARMHPGRQAFEKDESFVDLCCAIEEWYHKHGAAYLEEARRYRKEERYQRLGLGSLRVLEAILKLPGNLWLLDVIKGFKRGTVGVGHTELPKRQTKDEQERPSLSLDGKPGTPRPKTKEHEEARGQQEPQQEHTNHVPLTAAGPRGERRRVVTRSSFGLQFAHEAMEGVRELWTLDITEGVLTFNVRHPSWMTCEEKSDTAVMRLQEHVAMQALTLHAMPQEMRMVQRQVLDRLTDSVVTWIITSDRLRGVVSSRSKKAVEKK